MTQLPTVGVAAGAELSFHHVGFAVASIDESRNFFEMSGYVCSSAVLDKDQGVYLACCRSSEKPIIELVQPATTASPCSRFLDVNGPGPYHICYACSNIEESLTALTQSALRYKCITSEPRRSVLFTGASFVFLRVPKVGLVELLEVSREPEPTRVR